MAKVTIDSETIVRTTMSVSKMQAKIEELVSDRLKLLDEIDRWKLASGLEKGGDPDAVTPEDAELYLKSVEEENERLLGWKQIIDGVRFDSGALIGWMERAQVAEVEVARLRSMFDTTRHRVLRNMAVDDMGKSWSWIESEIGRIYIK